MAETKHSYTSLEALLSNTLDYAGTFPPASLSLSEAFKVAHRFRRRGKHSWLMAKSVVPLKQILETRPEKMFELGSDGSPLLFAALSNPESTLLKDLEQIRDFNLEFRHGPLQMEVVSLETRFLMKALSTPHKLGEISALLNEALDGLGRSFCIFFEVETSPTDYTGLSQIAQDLKQVRSPVGLKIRTGGERIPTTEELCSFILACRSNGLRFKATQDLHHAVSAKGQFGFLNLLTALSLSFSNPDFSEKEIKECLEEQNLQSFKFGEKSLEWSGYRLSLSDIEKARAKHWACFGSCSLDEPDQEISLLKMGV